MHSRNYRTLSCFRDVDVIFTISNAQQSVKENSNQHSVMAVQLSAHRNSCPPHTVNLLTEHEAVIAQGTTQMPDLLKAAGICTSESQRPIVHHLP